MALDILTRSRLGKLGPHTRRHAEMLLWEMGPVIRVSSTLRTPLRNRAVGGAPNSFHLRGRAVDFVGDAVSLHRAAAMAWSQRVGTGCTGPEEVLLEDLGRANQHLHVAW